MIKIVNILNMIHRNKMLIIFFFAETILLDIFYVLKLFIGFLRNGPHNTRASTILKKKKNN